MFLHKSIASHSNYSLYLLKNVYLAGFPTILDNYFTGVANTTSTPIEWEGEGRSGSHEMAGNVYVCLH